MYLQFRDPQDVSRHGIESDPRSVGERGSTRRVARLFINRWLAILGPELLAPNNAAHV
jgi:hypothetical protein